MKKKLIILFVLIILISIVSFAWWNQAVKPPDPTNKTNVNFVISRGETSRSVAERLQKQGLIRSSVAIFILARFGGLSANIQSGDFRLNPSMDLYTVAKELTHGTQDVWIVIPEGLRKEEIALKLAKDLSIPESEFNKVAKEGYMFPETYLVSKDATAGALVKLFTNTFNQKVSEKDKAAANRLNMSINDVIIIASLVEREAMLEKDRPLIASVILNRLKLGMKLDIDATIQYALGYQPKEKTWWKKDLTLEDLEIDSPYNTYKNNTLPPGPICNPGLSAIRAVLNAPDTEYLFYLADKNGTSHFGRNIEEHNANIAKYLNK